MVRACLLLKRLTVKKLSADLIGIAELLEEAGVLLDTLDTECLVLTTNGVDEVVVLESDRTGITADVRQVCLLVFGHNFSRDIPVKVTVLLMGSTS
jgi:hypothetical protein